MPELIPAILTSDRADLERKIRQTEAIATKAQVDFMDGRFVPSVSIEPEDLADIKTSLTLIAHLMVLQPSAYVKALGVAEFEMVIFHYEATDDPTAVVRALRVAGLGAGVAINPATPAPVLEPLLPLVDSVLFLSVDPGFYGSPFQPQVLDKIAAFRRRHPDMHAGIDGGINATNINLVKQLGINDVFVGSGIFGAGDPAENLRALRETVSDDC